MKPLAWLLAGVGLLWIWDKRAKAAGPAMVIARDPLLTVKGNKMIKAPVIGAMVGANQSPMVENAQFTMPVAGYPGHCPAPQVPLATGPVVLTAQTASVGPTACQEVYPQSVQQYWVDFWSGAPVSHKGLPAGFKGIPCCPGCPSSLGQVEKQYGG
jgi:hypothetical protein